MFKIPKPIEDGIDKLNALVEEYPQSIPIIVIANFLGVDKDALRTMLVRGTCPFGVGWVKPGAERMAAKIPTVTFYAWYTNMRGVDR